MENAQKWITIVNGALPSLMCFLIILAAIHSAYWHTELSKEFLSIATGAAGWLLRSATVAK